MDRKIHFGAKDTTYTEEFTIEDIDSGERLILEESKCEKGLGKVDEKQTKH